MVTPDLGAGVLLGLAAGDALGEPVEGWPADRIAREYGTLRDFVGGRVPPGGLTDDTAQALRLARSLAARGTFDPDDVADRFVSWYEGGPVGIGGMTRRVLDRVSAGQPWAEASREAWEESPEGTNAGNGSVMRCAPLAIAYAQDDAALGSVSRTSSRLTHADPRCVHGCAVLNRTIAGFLRGESDPLEAAIAGVSSEAPRGLVDALSPIPDGIEPSALSPTGYVVDTLQVALYEGVTAADAESAIVRAVNRGGDADTIGAVAGAVAGARFGASALPDRWLDALEAADELRRLGNELVHLTPT